MIETLLKIRKVSKSKKPRFERKDTHRYPQFKGIWRAPRGVQSKVRRGFKGNKIKPGVGYGSPKAVHGLTKHGLKPVVVSNLNDLKGLGNEHGLIISSNVGGRKKLVLLTKISELKLHVVNFGDIGAYLNKIKEKFEAKKKESKNKQDKRIKNKQEASKKAEEAKNKDAKKSEDEKEISVKDNKKVIGEAKSQVKDDKENLNKNEKL